MKNEPTDNLTLGMRYYKRSIAKSWIILAVLLVLVFLSIILAVPFGSGGLSFAECVKALFFTGTKDHIVLIWQARMPAIIASVICGASLSVAGCIMQTCLRNPLASPSTVGVTSAATFGVNLAIFVFGAGTIGSSSISFNQPYVISICSFAMALIAVFLTMLISKFKNFSAESIILSGTALSALFGAGTTLMQYFGSEDKIAAAVFWTFGDLNHIYWSEILIIAVVFAVCFIFFMCSSWNYNVMVTGEETAKSLGAKTSVIRVLGLVFATLLAAVSVSFVGLIGFIGLIGPHIVKRIIGVDHRFFIPASALSGALILSLAHTLSRTVMMPVVLPIGAITAIIGAPVFIIVLLKGLRKR